MNVMVWVGDVWVHLTYCAIYALLLTYWMRTSISRPIVGWYSMSFV
jgi:hypothetical protein